MIIYPETRAAILAAKGADTQVNIAADFDVSQSTVWAIWNPERAREINNRAIARKRERRKRDHAYAEKDRQKCRDYRAKARARVGVKA